MKGSTRDNFQASVFEEAVEIEDEGDPLFKLLPNRIDVEGVDGVQWS